MEKTVVRNNYVEELVNLIRSDLDKEELLEQISNYHENDIAWVWAKPTNTFC